MGSLIGHVLPGLGFFLFGFWHLFNHTKLHAVTPKSYTSIPWFPTSKLRYFELIFVMLGTSISIAMELFIGPERHQPLDRDGTIPSYHLRNFEHASISMSFFVYAAFAIVIDKINSMSRMHRDDLTQIIGAVALGQQLLMFHLHSTDHEGVEGQYHLMLQLIVAVSLVTTLMGIGRPKSFMISFVRSISILSQGLWLVVMGYMLWTPGLIPKHCVLKLEDGRQIVRCASEESLNRAKSLVNIEFSWFVIGITICSGAFYLVMVEIYGHKVEYASLAGKEPDEELEDNSNEEEDKSSKGKKFEDCMGTGFATLEVEM